ncbi:hypothetical protein D3C86_1941390 [compost metagenome]
MQSAHSGNTAGDGRIVAERHIARHIDQRVESSIVAVLDIQIADDHKNQVFRIAILVDFRVVVDNQVALDVDPGRPRTWRSQYPAVGRVSPCPVTIAHRNRTRIHRSQGGIARRVEIRQGQ